MLQKLRGALLTVCYSVWPGMKLAEVSQSKLSETQNLLVDISGFLLNVLVRWLITVVVIVCITLNYDVIPALKKDDGFYGPPAVIVAIAVGVLGGLISLYRRLPGLQLEELRLLNSSRLFTLLTPFVGGLLAGLLYIIFIAEIVVSDLFPAFTFEQMTPAGEPKAPPVSAFADLFQVRAKEGQDYAKLIVWCFVAGLSEKFVTNMLGGLQQAVSGGSGNGPGPAGGGAGNGGGHAGGGDGLDPVVIAQVTQGGEEGRQVAVSYEPFVAGEGVSAKIKWRVAGAEPGVFEEAALVADGNTLGPFPAGAEVTLFTEVSGPAGSRSTAPRTITIV